MRHCIIMTAYHDLPMINQFIDKIPFDWGIYIHIDAKSKINECKVNKRAKVYKINKIYWGAWEHLWTFCFLLREAYKENKYDYFHLVTGQDYFATDPNNFDSILGQNQDNYIGVFPIPNPRWGWDGGEKIFKYKTISSFADVRGLVPRVINKILFLIQKFFKLSRAVPDLKLYGGSVYSSLHREFVGWLLEDKTSQDLLNSLRHTTCAEEVYMPTVIMNSPYCCKCVSQNLRYDDWSVHPAPKYLCIDDFDKIVNSNSLFCRKVDSKMSAELLTRLDEFFKI